jgi:hypothetical protein
MLNTIENTFSNIKIHRPELAQLYLKLMIAQPDRPLALFAPRRVGKTFFLNEDLTPEAESMGFLPIYVDAWLNREYPLESINDELEEVLDNLTIPNSSLGKIAQTEVTKLSIFGTGADLKAPQRRELPDKPEFRFNALIGRITESHGGKILLMLDEAQSFGLHPNGVNLLSSLRAVLTKYKGKLFSVFTGSSRGDLTRMFTTAGAPMYQYAQSNDFPFLGDEYLNAIAKHFTKVHKTKSLSIDSLRSLFERIGHKPLMLSEVVKEMSAEGVVDCEQGMNLFLSLPAKIAGWNAILEPLNTLERAILVAINENQLLLSQKSPAYFENTTGKPTTISKIRTSINNLMKLKIINKFGEHYIIDDEFLAEHIKRQQVKI